MSCESCRILKDLKKALDPDRFIHGAEKNMGRAIDKCLEKHNKRVHAKKRT